MATMENQDRLAGVYKRALEITWLSVIFLVPLFFNPQSRNVFAISKTSLLQFLVAAMLAFWVADWLLSRAGHKQLKWQSVCASPLQLTILAFGLIAILTTAASIMPAISFWGSYFRKAGLLLLICWILFSLIIAQQLRTKTQLLRAICVLLASSGIVAYLGILQHFFPDAMFNVFHTTNPGRVFSTAGNPLFLSSFLAMVIPFNLALIVHSWSKRKERNNIRILIGLVTLLALQFWCLWLAQYSITILLYVIAPITFIILLGIVKRKKLLLGLGVVSLLALAIIAGLLLAPLLLSGPGAETPEPEDLKPVPISEKLELYSLGDRVQYWHSAIDIVLKSPEVPFSNDRLRLLRKVIGYGPETFIVTFQLFCPQKLKSTLTQISLLIDHPHNHYLYLATTIGLLGLMSFLSILAVFFYLCFRYLRRVTSDINKLVLIAMVAGMVQYMVDVCFNTSSIPPELVFWLTLALVPGIGKFVRNKEPAGTELEETARTESDATSYITRTRFFVSLGCALVLIIVGTGIAIRPFLADMYLMKGMALQRAGSEQAIYAFGKATSLDPYDATYWYALGAYDYSVARYVTEEPLKKEMLTLATDAYNKSLALRPYIASEHYFLADVYTYWASIGNNDKWPTALSLYDEASQLFPDNAAILNKWALALIIKGDLDEARTKLNYSASINPDWTETFFLSGLLLAREGENDEAVRKIIAPIQNTPANLNAFIDLCIYLSRYDMIKPLGDSLETYTQETPDDWIAHALLGITSLFGGNVDKSLAEFNTSMLLAPDNDAGKLFSTILKLSTMSQKLKTALPSVAAEWRAKLAQSPQRDTLLPILEQFIDNLK